MQAYREFTDAEISGLVIVEWDDITGPAEAYSPRGLAGLAAAAQIEGDLAGGEVVIEVSNDGKNFHPVTFLGSGDSLIAAPRVVEFSTSAAFIRPAVPAGAVVTVTLAVRS